MKACCNMFLHHPQPVHLFFRELGAGTGMLLKHPFLEVSINDLGSVLNKVLY
jgi:hypothetical protein